MKLTRLRRRILTELTSGSQLAQQNDRAYIFNGQRRQFHVPQRQAAKLLGAGIITEFGEVTAKGRQALCSK